LRLVGTLDPPCEALILVYANVKAPVSRRFTPINKNKGNPAMNQSIAKKVLPLISAFGLIVLSTAAWADDVDDVTAFLYRYAELESDLDAQASMIRDDRVMIAGSARQTDQAKNMEVQIAAQRANNAMAGGGKMVVRIESPEVRVYGDTAVASFMRLTNIFPANASPITPGPLWVSLVLVKERGNWAIAHTHISPVVPAN
jgi:ketosteroid isomerase-like protein